MNHQVQPPGLRAYRVREFCTSFGVSRTFVYSLIAAGRLQTVRVAGRRLIPVEAAEGLLARPVSS